MGLREEQGEQLQGLMQHSAQISTYRRNYRELFWDVDWTLQAQVDKMVTAGLQTSPAAGEIE